MDYEKRVTNAELEYGEEVLDASLRPKRMGDYIGRKTLRKILKYL